MPSIKGHFLAAVLATVAFGANANPLTLGDFTGSESLIDFDSVAFGQFTGDYTAQGVTVSAEAGKYMFQQSGGSLLGTSGSAFNTDSVAGNADVTLLFGTAISRFGVNFGTFTGPLSATVTAYDAADNVVESAVFDSFGHTFVGFDFASSVSKVVIDRTDNEGFFTFVDDIRFVNAAAVPEPGSLALLGLAGVAAAAVRRRRHR